MLLLVVHNACQHRAHDAIVRASHQRLVSVDGAFFLADRIAEHLRANTPRYARASALQFIAVHANLRSVIVDIVETGTTLKENHLKVITEFMPISARFIANRASYQFKHQEITTLLKKLAEVTQA